MPISNKTPKALPFLLLIHIHLFASTADMLIFSCNRPLQLYAFCESLEHYVTGLHEIHVLYRAREEKFEHGYNEVKKRFSSIHFTRQGTDPYTDFKPLTLEAIYKSPSTYIIFGVDDIIVKDYINIKECIDLMEQSKTYGFYLRLGTNITYSYNLNQPQKVPQLNAIKQGIYTWQFKQGEVSWRYCNLLDMALYRKTDIRHDFEIMQYRNPNNLEETWAKQAHKNLEKFGLCYKKSKIVNIPLNIVQDNLFTNNPHMHAYSPDELLEIFNRGLKIDIQPLFGIINTSPHMEYFPEFISR